MSNKRRHDSSSDDDDDDDDDIEYIPKTKAKRPKVSPEEELRRKVNASQMPAKAKQECLDKLKNNEGKDMTWVEKMLQLPWEKYIALPVTKQSPIANVHRYFEKVSKILDDAVHGMKTVKEEIINYIAQLVSTEGSSMPRIIGLCGVPGCGKTAIIRRGLAKALNKPMECFNMGGLRDSSYFLGHDRTYVGSHEGIIAKYLMKMQCMNGIFFFDEVDKISNSYDGIEIQNVLIHLTDPVQNHAFHDKYFAGIDIDISRLIMVFSFNDANLLDPILRDRIHIIQIPETTLKEKVEIGSKYLLKEIQGNIGFKRTEIILPDAVTEHIINSYCKDQKGVRKLKKCLESILLKLNTSRYLAPSMQKYKSLQQGIKIPFTITREIVDELIKGEHAVTEDKYLQSMYL